MSEWQPIETAPKGGEMVLLFVPLKHNGKFHIGAYRFNNGHWWTDSHTFVSNPTHWMESPEPPEDNSNKVFKCYCGKTEIIGRYGCCKDPDCIPY